MISLISHLGISSTPFEDIPYIKYLRAQVMIVDMILSDFTTLPEVVISQIIKLAHDVVGDGVTLSSDSIISKWLKHNGTTVDDTRLSKLSAKAYRDNLVSLKKSYLKIIQHFRNIYDGSQCKMWIVLGMIHSTINYGIVCIFHNKGEGGHIPNKDSVLVQEEVSFLIPYLCKNMFPILFTALPSLDVLFDSDIKHIARSVEASKIYQNQVSDDFNDVYKLNRKLSYGRVPKEEYSDMKLICGCEETKFPWLVKDSKEIILLDRYELLEVLGKGSFGTVYKAYDRQVGRMVAFKHSIHVLDRKGDKMMGLEDILNEVGNHIEVKSLDFIPKAFDFQQIDKGEAKNSYLVQQYINGKTIYDIQKESYDDEFIWSTFLLCMKAVKKLHDHGFIHNDIHYSNIMVSYEGKVYFIDIATMTKINSIDVETVKKMNEDYGRATNIDVARSNYDGFEYGIGSDKIYLLSEWKFHHRHWNYHKLNEYRDLLFEVVAKIDKVTTKEEVDTFDVKFPNDNKSRR